MQLELVPQRIVAGFLDVRPDAVVLHRLSASPVQRKTLDKISRLLEELDEYRHPKIEDDEWLCVADLVKPTGWTPQWLTELCRAEKNRRRRLFRTKRMTPRGRWLIHRPSFERWLSSYAKERHGGPETT